MKRFFLLACLLSALSATQLFALENGVARTPPMGWNSWNKFGCDVNESLLRDMTDTIVSSGMKDAGYQYVIIDDCWQVERDATGNIVPDAKRFPSGMKALGDYIHSKGLKFGIYSDAGTGTCQNRPGSRGYEFQDARQYAAWGVDYLKYDWCNHSTQDSKSSYALMTEALSKSGRPIVFGLCEWGSTQPWLWAGNVGNLWRSTGDIVDKWDVHGKDEGDGVIQILELNNGLESYAGPGHWNDPDMLEVGNGGMTTTEYRSHFSLWALMAAPLLAGNDLKNMTAETREILTNKEVIAIDQDPMGIQGHRVKKDGDSQIWVKQLSDGSRCVVLFNTGSADAKVTLKWPDIGYPAGLSASVRDLWAHENLGSQKGTFSANVPGHGVEMILVKP